MSLSGIQLEDAYYDILAGVTRGTCLFAAVDLGLDTLLAPRPLTEAEIVERLQLDPVRGHKWLVLLESVDLIAASPDPESGAPRYRNGALLQGFANPETTYFFREFLRYWRVAAFNEMTRVVRGAPVDNPVRYPPEAEGDVALLHDWMRDGALITLNTIEKVFDFGTVRRMLDVGGGDATIACELVRRHPQLHSTVFNLPKAARLGLANVGSRGLGARVAIAVGDFLNDPLPLGDFDLVMFSRVLADWSPEVCRSLLRKAHASLAPGGRLLIAEPFRDDNPSLSIAWEHSYLPYDDFGAYVYKTSGFYRGLFGECGFADVEHHPRGEASIHGVMVARRA